MLQNTKGRSPKEGRFGMELEKRLIEVECETTPWAPGENGMFPPRVFELIFRAMNRAVLTHNCGFKECAGYFDSPVVFPRLRAIIQSSAWRLRPVAFWF